MPRARTILILLAAALATYLIGNERVSLWDRDEPRYAQTSRQMLQSGDWVVPRFLDTVRTAKPVFIYWCQATSMKVFGDNAAAARLPSAIAMTATLALLGIVIRGRRGVWTMFILASSALVIWSAKSALTDAVLLLFVTVAQLCVYLIWRGRFSWRVAIALGVSVGLAGLTKGPIVIGVMGTTVVALWLLRLAAPRRRYSAGGKRDAVAEPPPRFPADGVPPSGARLNEANATLSYRRIKPEAALLASRYAGIKIVLAIAITVAVVTPWLVMVHHRHPGFISAAWNKEVVDRTNNAQEGHTGPPGYYLFTVWGMFFPWSLFLPATAVIAWKHRHIPQIRFALAAVIGPWVMLELVKTKLPHYLLPAYPFLAFLTADMLVRAGRKRIKDLVNPAFVWITLGWAVMVGLMGLMPWIVLRWYSLDRNTTLAMVVVSILAIEWGRNVYVCFRAKRPLVAAELMGWGMLVIVIVLHIGVLPGMDFLRVSKRTADVLIAEGASREDQEIMIDYKEPSLAFYQGGTIREEWRNDYLSIVHPIYWPMWIVTTSDVWATVPTERKEHLEVMRTISGLDYAGRGRVDVMVLRRK